MEKLQPIQDANGRIANVYALRVEECALQLVRALRAL